MHIIRLTKELLSSFYSKRKKHAIAILFILTLFSVVFYKNNSKNTISFERAEKEATFLAAQTINLIAEIDNFVEMGKTDKDLAATRFTVSKRNFYVIENSINGNCSHINYVAKEIAEVAKALKEMCETEAMISIRTSHLNNNGFSEFKEKNIKLFERREELAAIAAEKTKELQNLVKEFIESYKLHISEEHRKALNEHLKGKFGNKYIEHVKTFEKTDDPSLLRFQGTVWAYIPMHIFLQKTENEIIQEVLSELEALNEEIHKDD